MQEQFSFIFDTISGVNISDINLLFFVTTGVLIVKMIDVMWMAQYHYEITPIPALRIRRGRKIQFSLFSRAGSGKNLRYFSWSVSLLPLIYKN